MRKLVMITLSLLLLIPGIAGCGSYSIPDDIVMSSPGSDFQPEVEILDAYCINNQSSSFLFKFTLKNLKNEDIEVSYYWTLNEPGMDFLNSQKNINDPQARIFQGKESIALPAGEAKPVVLDLKQDKEYDPRFYVMYISVYRDDTQVGYYQGQKSTYDWDYSITPPVPFIMPRPLTDTEKANVAEIAIASNEATAWLQGRTDYRIGEIDWYAIVWSDGSPSTWWAVDYDTIESEGIPDFISKSALWYPGVTIAIGEGTIYQMQIAVDLETGKAVMVEGPYPSLDSPDRFRHNQEYSLEVVKSAYEEIIKELFDKRQLYDKVSMTGYSSTEIILSFYSQTDPEIVSLVQSMIDIKVPGIRLIVNENVPAPTSMLPTTPRISKEQAIETASKTLPSTIVDRAEISAELHVWYWEVIFDNLNAEADELEPWPLKPPPPPPPGQPDEDPYAGIWQSVIITVDAQTGDLKSAGARQAPEPGPYISQEQAINSAREMMLQTPADINWGVDVTWFEKAKAEAYLRGDTWIILFWEEGSTDNRFSVNVNAVTGEATGASRG